MRMRPMSGILHAQTLAELDMIDHPALMDRVRRRVGDKRVLAVVKAFLHAGVPGEDGVELAERVGRSGCLDGPAPHARDA